MIDPGVRAALERALDEDADQVGVRLHLAELLIDEEPSTALDHATQVLSQCPDDVAALRIASFASNRLGDAARAERYDRLIRALGQSSLLEEREPASAPKNAAVAPMATPVALGAEAGELDQFLADLLDDPDSHRGGITMADVGGLDDVKQRLETSFFGPLRNPELRRMYGKSLRGGLLLYGPPGCGKTFLARAIAGELGARFFSVSLSDVLNMWLGESEQRLHSIFNAARRHAPCVLFLDEVDALGLRRSNLNYSAARSVVVQLLTEMDSTTSDNKGLFILGATNQPWDLDPALRRPGRFDRMMLVLPPDAPARRAIIDYHLRDRPLADVSLDQLVGDTDGFSGADLRLLCESAAEAALADSMASGVARPIQQADFHRGLREIKPSTRSWFQAAERSVIAANENTTYEELLSYVRTNKVGRRVGF